MNWKTWLGISILCVIAVIALLADFSTTLATEDQSTSLQVPVWLVREYWGIPFWILILVIVAVLYAASRISYGSTSISFAPGSFWMKLITSFLVLATFFYLLSKIYPNAPLFQPGEGYGHIALYFLLAALMAMVAANLEGKAWFVNFILVILMFAMIGHRTADLLDPSGRLLAKISSPFGSNGVQTASVATANCVGLKTITLGTEPVPVNPRGFCSVATWLPAEGCIYQQPARSTRIFGPLGNCARSIGQKGPPDVEYMWSAENHALMVDVDLASPHKYD